MRVRHKPTRAEKMAVAEEVSNEFITCLQDENAINFIATVRYFGLGKKRARKYLNFLAEVKSEYNKYGFEGTMTHNIEQEVVAVGIDPEELYEKHHSFKEALRQNKSAKKNIVTLAEAYELEKKFNEMKKLSDSNAILTDRAK